MYGTTNARFRDAMAETNMNLRGLKCPLPALKTRKALKALKAGDMLVIECTDPLAAIDIPNLLRETGDVLEDTRHESDTITFRIRKS
jgi:tRNA 2-thiouridine synthesizing protein A